MRNRGEIVGVVDLGSREIRVLIARRQDDGEIQVIGHGATPGRGCIWEGVIQDRVAAQMALKRALAHAEKEARVRVPKLFCGINGRNVETFVREGLARMEREVVEDRHMDEARDMASRDVLASGKTTVSSRAAREWYIDDMRVYDPAGLRGQVLRTRMHFARLPAVIQDNIRACIESQNRELEDMIFTPLAASLGCLTPEDVELGVAVLDMGRTTTGLAVFRDHRILGTHCFELGGYHLTRDVAAGLHVSFEEADELILEYGIAEDAIASACAVNCPDGERNARIKLKTAVPGARTVVDRKDFDTIVVDRARELFVKVRQDLHARGLAKHLVRGVVLTGGASLVKNSPMLAEAVFQVPCRVGYPNAVDVLPHGVESPVFSTALGIVRHGFATRAAARNGNAHGAGAARGGLRRLGRFFKRYFL